MEPCYEYGPAILLLSVLLVIGHFVTKGLFFHNAELDGTQNITNFATVGDDMIGQGSDTWHKKQYEAALAFAGHEGPAWEDLPPAVRESIRKVNFEHTAYMRELGERIRRGDNVTDIMKGST